MVFNSLQYLVFFPLVFVVYWQLKRRAQNILLLAASWFFYAMWDWRFLGLMLLTTGVDFAVGRYLAMTEDDRKRKLAFGLSLGLNLAVLGFFKYFNFFIGSAADLLRAAGFDASEPTLRILLPDRDQLLHVPRDQLHVRRLSAATSRPPTDLLDFAVFVAFFPQLVAGPIGRAHIQLPQFEHDRPPLRWPTRSSRALPDPARPVQEGGHRRRPGARSSTGRSPSAGRVVVDLVLLAGRVRVRPPDLRRLRRLLRRRPRARPASWASSCP